MAWERKPITDGHSLHAVMAELRHGVLERANVAGTWATALSSCPDLTDRRITHNHVSAMRNAIAGLVNSGMFWVLSWTSETSYTLQKLATVPTDLNASPPLKNVYEYALGSGRTGYLDSAAEGKRITPRMLEEMRLVLDKLDTATVPMVASGNIQRSKGVSISIGDPSCSQVVSALDAASEGGISLDVDIGHSDHYVEVRRPNPTPGFPSSAAGGRSYLFCGKFELTAPGPVIGHEGVSGVGIDGGIIYRATACQWLRMYEILQTAPVARDASFDWRMASGGTAWPLKLEDARTWGTSVGGVTFLSGTFALRELRLDALSVGDLGPGQTIRLLDSVPSSNLEATGPAALCTYIDPSLYRYGCYEWFFVNRQFTNPFIAKWAFTKLE